MNTDESGKKVEYKDIKVYAIEESDLANSGGAEYFRFRSLFNGAKGIWRKTKEEAIEDGEAHKKCILFLKGE